MLGRRHSKLPWAACNPWAADWAKAALKDGTCRGRVREKRGIACSQVFRKALHRRERSRRFGALEAETIAPSKVTPVRVRLQGEGLGSLERSRGPLELGRGEAGSPPQGCPPAWEAACTAQPGASLLAGEFSVPACRLLLRQAAWGTQRAQRLPSAGGPVGWEALIGYPGSVGALGETCIQADPQFLYENLNYPLEFTRLL